MSGRDGLFILSWFVAGGLAFYAWLVHTENEALQQDMTTLQDYRQRYEEQLALNTRQREEFEAQVDQLQNNLRSSQAQLSNLSEALQEAREMMEPVAEQVMEQLSTDTPEAAR